MIPDCADAALQTNTTGGQQKMKYGDIEDAFIFVSQDPYYECTAFINRESGDIYYHSEIAELDELPADIDDDEKYITVPHRNDLDLGKSLVFKYVATRLPGDADAVSRIFSRKGAYSRYKQLLEQRGKLEDWYAYEAAQQRTALEAWCREIGIALDDAPPIKPPAPIAISPAFTTDKVAETRDFFVNHFGARVTFDCGWYVNLEFGDPGVTLQFMSPREDHHSPSDSDGLIYNFRVDNVDAEYVRLTAAGLSPVMPLEDHPWGDRGFAVTDPNGISLYIYSERAPSAEFRQYFNR